jgi:hypothetical protein
VTWSELLPSGPDPDTEAVVVAAGWAVWHRARADVLCTRLEAADDLVTALDTYDAVFTGAISPAAFWPDLEHDGGRRDEGLRRAAEAVLHSLAALIAQAPALAGGRRASEETT